GCHCHGEGFWNGDCQPHDAKGEPPSQHLTTTANPYGQPNQPQHHRQSRQGTDPAASPDNEGHNCNPEYQTSHNRKSPIRYQPSPPCQPNRDGYNQKSMTCIGDCEPRPDQPQQRSSETPDKCDAGHQYERIPS